MHGWNILRHHLKTSIQHSNNARQQTFQIMHTINIPNNAHHRLHPYLSNCCHVAAVLRGLIVVRGVVMLVPIGAHGVNTFRV